MFDKLYGMMNWPVIEGIEYTDIDNPRDILGQHLIEDGLLIQAFIPDAESVQIKCEDKLYDMYRMDDDGFYAGILDSDKTVTYKLVVKRGDRVEEFYDAYAFYMPEDVKKFKKFNAGIAYDAYQFMGAHECTVSGVEGVKFCCWAPRAIRVSVVGDFNHWDGRIHQMTRIEDTGVFEIFIPGVKAGAIYKYEIKMKGGKNLLKADPYAFKMEQLPGDASIVADVADYAWTDDTWLKAREKFNFKSSPVSIYQLSIANFKKNDGIVNYREIAPAVADYVLKTGYTHVELLPFAEYRNEDANGYITDFLYAPTSRYGINKDLMYFVNYLHSKGIGVIYEWTPTQFASDETGMGYFDGSCVYESENPKRAINPRTGGHMYNYARPEVTSYLIANAFMWIKQYHFDGICLVNTAELLYHDYGRKPGEWEANIYGGTHNLEAIEFLKHFNSIVHKDLPGIMTIADETSGYPDLTGEVSENCLGFDMKWNHEWRKDTLNFLAVPPMMRKQHYHELSLDMIYQYTDNFAVGYQAPEFVSGKASMLSRMAGDTEEVKLANMKLALAYEFVYPGKKMMFMGQDLATYAEWIAANELDFGILNEDKHKNVYEMLKALNKMYRFEPSLYELDDDESGFEWINNISANECVLTFVRKGKKEEEMLLVVCNFDAVDRTDYKIGVPKQGKYKEIFNSDQTAFGGKGFVNARLKQSKTDECDGREESVRLNLAGLSVSVYKYSKADEKVADNKAAKAKTAEKTKPAEKAAEKKQTKTEPKKAVKKAEVKAEPKVEVKAEAKPEVKPEVKVEPKIEEPKKVEPKVEVKAEAKPEVKPEVKVEPKIEEPKKVETKVEVKAEAKTEVKAVPKKPVAGARKGSIKKKK